ncbi:histone-lysine N-methyltransferase SETMAR-like [Mercenaria mercenaria]|uniref:histone-lysine N-methyltransferase SETMAR-like n=1 Tax=Mercenaria mercenaria TaxID=6596 RepID=UPI00234E60A5|nr:histone-lysine N-methyltransferase SETMAR-like [Mercenaria mercenaria]
MSKIDISCGSENFPINLEDVKLQTKLSNFQYVCCNIPGPGTYTMDFEDQLQGCTCPGKSCDISVNTKCTCMTYGSSYTADARLHKMPSSKKEITVFNECNSLCTCSSSCTNRVVQHGITTRLEVFWVEDKGLCLRTLEPIECGKFVCEYAGEVLTREEAKRRAEKQNKDDMNYIFVLNEHFTSGIHTTYIDPCKIGNVGRFISHSCEPNLSIYPVRVHNLVPKVCLFTARDICANEELTYDYGQNDDQLQRNTEGDKKICKCKSDACKGFLPFDLSVLK